MPPRLGARTLSYVVHRHPRPPAKSPTRSTAGTARKQRKHHTSGPSLSCRASIVTRSSYACGIILRRVSFPNTRLYNVTGDHMDATAIILAAGEGTRMKSNHCKVSHKILGKPMVQWIVDATIKPAAAASWSSSAAMPTRCAPHRWRLRQQRHQGRVRRADRAPGTGHAVKVALEACGITQGPVVVLNGDCRSSPPTPSPSSRRPSPPASSPAPS